ncbi:hypothetical protein DI392_09235 [Vibrio albus]|uniref:DUF1107 domain-containing protein n=1 Tax=Vibrio albus TaxID=2200953 RepID=A0A2U3BA76_9VIBR|nr:DUF1107 family protein [Vibrio albus]PWI33635.1 hypothetical protein DI392_09235 [Vibrio albus]
MLKEFTTYRPLQVAKFVKTLFKGEFLIAGIGMFYFDKGKVLLPDVTNKQMLSVMKEVNIAIDSLSAQPV